MIATAPGTLPRVAQTPSELHDLKQALQFTIEAAQLDLSRLRDRLPPSGRETLPELQAIALRVRSLGVELEWDGGFLSGRTGLADEEE